MSKPSADALELVKSLMALPENSMCADCQKKVSRWASSTLGVFICIDCSGIHRSLGTHISFVRSCTLDSWTPEQARLMKKVGNKIANQYWEARLPPGFVRPNTTDRAGMTAFIRAKYIERRWAAPGEPPQNQAAARGNQQFAKPSIKMYEGYFQNNPLNAQQPMQPHYQQPQQRKMPSSFSSESFSKINHKFAAHPRQNQQHTNQPRSGMGLDEFMNKMNASSNSENSHASTDETPSSFSFINEAAAQENQTNQQIANNSEQQSSFGFINEQAAPQGNKFNQDHTNQRIVNNIEPQSSFGFINESNKPSNSGLSQIEVNSDNPFGPNGQVKEISPLNPSFQSNIQQHPSIPSSNSNQTEQVISNASSQPAITSHNQGNLMNKPSAPSNTVKNNSPSAMEILQQGNQAPQKITCVGMKKQSLFGKKSKAASKFGKKPIPPQGSNVVDQMLNLSDAGYRPISAPVSQGTHPQLNQFVPSNLQQRNYMIHQQQFTNF